jgi:hypothetical protein
LATLLDTLHALRIATCRFALCDLRCTFHRMNRPALVSFMLACAACVEEAPVSQFPEQVIPTTITTSDNDLQPGETATLSVTITNTLEEGVQLTFPTSCQAFVYIRNSSGRVTTPENGTYECASVPSSINLDVGASKTFTFEWGGGIEFGPPGSSTRVPPGSYYASAELRADGYLALAFPILIVVH